MAPSYRPLGSLLWGNVGPGTSFYPGSTTLGLHLLVYLSPTTTTGLESPEGPQITRQFCGAVVSRHSGPGRFKTIITITRVLSAQLACRTLPRTEASTGCPRVRDSTRPSDSSL